jgi:TfoX/Sxy family transcriptional regulator of competence genes
VEGALATAQRTVDVMLEAMAGAGAVSARKMFGEWGIYCDGKLVALVCDEQLFVKVTEAGRAFLGDTAELAPAYPGAKPSFRIDAERWDDAEWMSELVRVTWAELPVAAAKQPKKKATTLPPH